MADRAVAQIEAAMVALVPAGVRSALFAIGFDYTVGITMALYTSTRRAAPRWPHECLIDPGEHCHRCNAGHAPDARVVLRGLSRAQLDAALGDVAPKSWERPYALVRDGALVRCPPPSPADAWGLDVDDAAGTARLTLPTPQVPTRRYDVYELAARRPDHALALVPSPWFDPLPADLAALASVQALVRARLGGEGRASRAIHLQLFVDWARAVFARQPKLRSAMLCVAQYYNDSASDECHGETYASERDTPVWPHPCAYEAWEWDTWEGPPNGEYCDTCGKLAIEYGVRYGTATEAFEAFSIEGAHQGMDASEAYRPFAVARRGAGGEPVLELVATCRRKGHVLGELASGPPWPDGRAVLLARNPDARGVLADHLQVVGDPRGEVIARELVGDPRAAGCDTATAAYRAQLLGPLGRVACLEGATFRGGALVGLVAHAASPADAAACRGEARWQTLEVLHALPGSVPLVDPAMRALREVGVVGAGDVAALAELARRGAPIDTLQLAADDLDPIAALAIPTLRHVRVHDRGDLGRVAWWGRLARVTLLGDDDERVGTVPAALADVPVIAWSRSEPVTARPCGWQLALDRVRGRAEISLVGWDPSATLAALREVVVPRAKQLAREVAVVASPYFTPTAEEAAGWPARDVTPLPA